MVAACRLRIGEEETITVRYDITNIEIEDYLTALMPPREPVLAKLEERARQQGLSLVGPVQGEFLYLQALSMGARKALEVGMTTGYAAVCLLRALQQTDGHLTSIESHADRIEIATGVISEAGLPGRITVLHGEWTEVMPTLDKDYDLIFLDILRSAANDGQASQALELCVQRLRSGGVLIADNVLCSAQVLEEDAPPLVHGIQLFNQALMRHPQLESVIIPLRDGVAICRKK